MKIYDISLPISHTLTVWPGDPRILITQVAHIERGDMATVSRMDMSAHSGTHVDAPAHFVLNGATVETLDLNVLVGPVQVFDVRPASSISAAVLESLSLHPAITRVLFRSSNSDRWAAGESDFSEDFVAVSADGARWLVEHGIRLVGVDCLSVAPFHDLIPTHVILLEAGVIPIEGLNLSRIEPGDYELVCLPLNIVGSDGSPARAILIERDNDD